ncbi:MAG: TlyA family RNA methyltransferase [Smithella sp.]|jgi:23S rRNA (cytidine1920-2'-O)/16S rRNA (cytidine1409-2'-O)-methyltransferase|nr:TlyA family RNA methyltransferase [Smithella sp.]MDD5524824.1 TlyA family RNA methyltransferase [Smithella sp.]
MAIKKIRLDKLLVDRGVTPTLEKARALILARAVKVNDAYPDKAGELVPVDSEIHIKGEDNPYVSRGGLKLAGALKEFNLNVENIVALDVGASTGGFTDCLLQAGAKKVYALDVGYGQLAWKLREDKRVVVIERTNVRYYDGADLDEQIDLAVIDASFISLKIVLPAVLKLFGDKAQILALIKPQFEVAREEVGKGGVVQYPAIHDRVVQDISEFCESLNLEVEGTCASPISGPSGNREFFILARKKEQNGN